MAYFRVKMLHLRFKLPWLRVEMLCLRFKLCWFLKELHLFCPESASLYSKPKGLMVDFGESLADACFFGWWEMASYLCCSGCVCLVTFFYFDVSRFIIRLAVNYPFCSWFGMLTPLRFTNKGAWCRTSFKLCILTGKTNDNHVRSTADACCARA